MTVKVTTRTFLKSALGLAATAVHSIGSAAEEDFLTLSMPGKVPPGYAPSYLATVRAAEDEGRLIIYSTTDADVADPLIADFKAMYPKIEVEYSDLNSTVLHHRFIAETQLGPESADVMWSSAMDQQASLVSSGYSMAYDSPEKGVLPAWAVWPGGLAYATSLEPVALVYNKALLPADQVPRTHADLVKLLVAEPARFKGKVITYDVEKSGVGFFLATRDLEALPTYWDLARALGKVESRFSLTTEAMLKSVASGQSIIGYNLLGGYATAFAKKQSAIGVLFPADYTLVMARTMFIGKKAGNPNAARLWLDYVLSKRGQTVIANRGGLTPIRDDVSAETSALRLSSLIGGGFKPIALGPSLIGYLNNENYRDFIRRWRKAAANR